jgi:biopolymer transport protein ExbD
MNFRKHCRETGIGFQIAPMVDIAFLILLFFISASIYAEWELKLGINIPTSKTGEMVLTSPLEIVINLDAEGHIFLNSIEYDHDRLGKLLGEQAKMYPGQPVIIRADKKTSYEKVITVLDICKNVDIGNVSFATLPDKSQNSLEK